MFRPDQTLQNLDVFRKNVARIGGISLGLFGSRRYGSPDPIKSDYDLFVIIEDDSKICDFADPRFTELLFGDVLFEGGKLSVIPEEDVKDMLDRKVGILQAGGIPVDANVPQPQLEIYIARLEDLVRICAEEPGGELMQRYNTSPTEKSVKPYVFRMTREHAGIQYIQYDQNVEYLITDLNAVMGTGIPVSVAESGIVPSGMISISAAKRIFSRYQKGSPGLPRRGGNAIMIGTTGDKILSLGLIHEHSSTAKDLLIPAFARASKDYSLGENEEPFSSVLQRYSRFSGDFISHMEGKYKKTLKGNLRKNDFMVI